ncbi:MAG: AAA family ATPase [Cyanobacteria bacterium]|nr:AAA family ATPase [Cyanobacteriota bacterium]
MADEGVKPFANNWAYLKVELRWLDRVLLSAVSRHRSEEKAVGRVAQTERDHVTSPWWKGIVTLPRSHPREEGPPPKGMVAGGSYSQQLEARIQASRGAGIALALPDLRDGYQLTTFEKNLILLALAPEINRRYGRLYDYLQEESGELEDLPTVDLCLRLLCHNDRAWQEGRSRLAAADSLAAKGLVEWIGDEGTLLSHQVRLADALVNYLLAADPPTPVPNFALLPEWHPPSSKAGDSAIPDADRTDEDGDDDQDWEADESSGSPDALASEAEALGSASPTLVVAPHIPNGDWQTLVLPPGLKTQLQALGRQGSQRQRSATAMGLMVLLVGPRGTGKTTAATAIATDMAQSLAILDLATVTLGGEADLLETALADGRPLLVQAGHHWWGRRATLESAQLHQWWQQRQRTSGLTLVTVTHLQAIQPQWRRRFDAILTFPLPDLRARQKIWATLWPDTLTLRDIDWRWVAQQLPLSGGDMAAIAQTACLELQARQRHTLTLKVLRQAVALHHPHLAPALGRASPSG